MSILSERITQDILKKLSPKIRKNKAKTTVCPKFVFICGEQIIDENGVVRNDEELTQSQNKRHHLITEFQKEHTRYEEKTFKSILCVISEKMYSNDEIVDTLTFEELLADLSDQIIIIVESPGTICELGAFTVKKEYINKLLIINNKAYENNKSFINEGPIKKMIDIKEDKVIWTSYEFNEFKEDFFVKSYIKEVIKRDLEFQPNKTEKLDLKNLVYELFNIIEIFSPLNKKELLSIYKSTKGLCDFEIKNRSIHKINAISKVINIMEKMQLVNINEDYITPNTEYSCFNALFNISRSEFNSIRSEYLALIYKKHRYRLQECDEDDIRVN